MTLQTKLLNDLRFFIGLFFLMVGLILICVGAATPSQQAGVNLNLLTGVCFTIFSVLALIFAVRAAQRGDQ